MIVVVAGLFLTFHDGFFQNKFSRHQKSRLKFSKIFRNFFLLENGKTELHTFASENIEVEKF